MWKAAAGTQIYSKQDQDAIDDDWETDPDFVNNVTEEQQRWGSTTIQGSGRTAGAIDMEKLIRETEAADKKKKQQELLSGPNASFGYGGKFGLQNDRMDNSAVGHDYVAVVEKHVSQKDYSTGFGGKFGVQSDRVDKSALSWDHKEKVEKHTSQKDYSTGFGGKFGVQKDRQDKSAVGWEYIEKTEKHESQKDYVHGFGGKFGVQKDRQDKSAVGWDHHEAPQKHESQIDHKIGFGGKFGVQSDRMDKSALTFDEESAKVGTTYTKVTPDIGNVKQSDLRAKFERMATEENKPSTTPTSQAVRNNVQSKAAIFINKVEAKVPVAQPTVPKLNQSKIAFLTQNSETEVTATNKINTKYSDKLRIQDVLRVDYKPNMVEESEEKKDVEPEKKDENVVMKDNEQIDKQESEQNTRLNVKTTDITPSVEVDYDQEDEIVDTGLSAVALYDYLASADDEISFDPGDSITHIEMIDQGWWRGMCKGFYGLFPANYVQLQE